ncbi:MAG: carbohydrate-binding protein, partial [Jatrophihabitantaceae bacterium]
LPANASGAGGGAVAPSVVNNALDCLATGASCGSFHPPARWSIRGAMDWDINWDANAGYNFANTVGGHLGSLP